MSESVEEEFLNALECPGGQQKFLDLLQKMPDLAANVSIKGKSLIHYVAENRWWHAVLQMCINYKYVPNDSDADPFSGSTILHKACVSADIETVKYLISNFYLDPLKKNNHGATPVDYSSGETKEYLEQLIGTDY